MNISKVGLILLVKESGLNWRFSLGVLEIFTWGRCNVCIIAKKSKVL